MILQFVAVTSLNAFIMILTNNWKYIVGICNKPAGSSLVIVKSRQLTCFISAFVVAGLPFKVHSDGNNNNNLCNCVVIGPKAIQSFVAATEVLSAEFSVFRVSNSRNCHHWMARRLHNSCNSYEGHISEMTELQLVTHTNACGATNWIKKK